jgi:uncharacterized membrane protein
MISAIITTLSFFIMMASSHLKERTVYDRQKKKRFEQLSLLAFLLSFISLITNWTQVAHIHGIIHVPIFDH